MNKRTRLGLLGAVVLTTVAVGAGAAYADDPNDDLFFPPPLPEFDVSVSTSDLVLSSADAGRATITVSNVGQRTASNLQVSLDVPGGITAITSSNPEVSCRVGSVLGGSGTRVGQGLISTGGSGQPALPDRGDSIDLGGPVRTPTVCSLPELSGRGPTSPVDGVSFDVDVQLGDPGSLRRTWSASLSTFTGGFGGGGVGDFVPENDRAGGEVR